MLPARLAIARNPPLEEVELSLQAEVDWSRLASRQDDALVVIKAVVARRGLWVRTDKSLREHSVSDVHPATDFGPKPSWPASGRSTQIDHTA